MAKVSSLVSVGATNCQVGRIRARLRVVLPPIATLRKQLESSYPIGDDPWWLRRKDYTREEVPPLREKRACIRLATDNSLETMLVDDLMALFDETNTLIEQANQDMVSAIQQGHLPA